MAYGFTGGNRRNHNAVGALAPLDFLRGTLRKT